MNPSDIDHTAHGWALLALRLPGIRSLRDHRQTVGEMCECYSIAVLQLRMMKAIDPGDEQIVAYEALVTDIEEEVSYYLKTVARLSVDGVAISGPGQPWAG